MDYHSIQGILVENKYYLKLDLYLSLFFLRFEFQFFIQLNNFD